MPATVPATVPERIIKTMLGLGVAAITADPTELDSIWAQLEASELAGAKARWAATPPTVVLGFPRDDTPFPVLAVILMSDATNQDYIGQNELAIMDAFEEITGFDFSSRTEGVFGIHVFARNPDECAQIYRVAKRICRVGTRHLMQRGLQEPKVDGQDLTVVDPQLAYENLWVRRLTLAVQYEENWPDNGSLWDALNPPVEERITGTPAELPGKLSIHHEDVDLDGDGVPDGGVHPI